MLSYSFPSMYLYSDISHLNAKIYTNIVLLYEDAAAGEGATFSIVVLTSGKSSMLLCWPSSWSMFCL